MPSSFHQSVSLCDHPYFMYIDCQKRWRDYKDLVQLDFTELTSIKVTFMWFSEKLCFCVFAQFCIEHLFLSSCVFVRLTSFEFEMRPPQGKVRMIYDEFLTWAYGKGWSWTP
jgi:hypothetical protein